MCEVQQYIDKPKVVGCACVFVYVRMNSVFENVNSFDLKNNFLWHLLLKKVVFFQLRQSFVVGQVHICVLEMLRVQRHTSMIFHRINSQINP